MSRSLLLVTLLLAAYTLISLVVSPIVVAASKRLLARQTSVPARAWFWLRLAPVAAGLAGTVGLVLPAFATYEPMHDGEEVGPALVTLAAVAISVLAWSCRRLARATWNGWRFRQRWLRSADVNRIEGSSLPVHVIDRTGPLVALVGVVRPRLVLSSHVKAVCSDRELLTILAHEAAHLSARDNLKRLLLDVCPDPLRFTPVHHTLTAAWSAAAEQEADDAAAGAENPGARLALASLLVKLARLSAAPTALPSLSSPFVGHDDLASRVRRLLEEPTCRRPSAPWSGTILGAVTVTAVGWTWSAPELLEAIHNASEMLVHLGR